MSSTRQGRTLVVVVVLVSLVVVTLGATWARRAWLGWERSRERAHAGRECRTALKGVFVAEKSLFAERDRFTEDFREMGYIPERGNRSALLLSRAGPREDRDKATVSSTGPVGIIGADEYRFPRVSTSALLARIPASAPIGMSGTCPACEVVAVCVTEVQVWSMATFARTMPDGGVVPSGLPHLDQSDL